jgi:DNA polymerase elongation subunit (family B)
MATSTHSPERGYLNIIDFTECYESDTVNEYMCLIGRNQNGAVTYVDVEGIPHEVYIAIGEDLTPSQSASLVADLHEYLLANPHKCRRTGCACGNGGWGGVSREVCINDRKRCITEAIRSYDTVRRRGFSVYEENDRPFLRIVFTHAFYAMSVEEWAKTQSFGTVSNANAGLYECRPKAVDSFIVLKNIASFDWVSFPKTRRRMNGHYRVSYQDLVVEKEVSFEEAPPYVTLYLDIETIAKRYINSESEKAVYPVGVISVVTSTGEKKSFMLGPSIEVEHVETFENETDLFQAFYCYVRKVDPDIIAGYNTNKFDIPYLLTRAERLGMKRFRYLSRLSHMPVHLHRSQTFTNGGGTQTNVFIDCPGVIFLDLYPLIRKGYKFENYKLATVLNEFKLDAKGDVNYEEIHPYFYGSMEQRRKLETYCMRDTQGVREVQGKTDAIRRLVAKCKVLRLRARDALDRGLGYVLSMKVASTYRVEGYLNKKKEYTWNEAQKEKVGVLDSALEEIEGYGDLWKMKENHEKYPGAFVFEPLRAFYREFILTLDFNSLYPSIIQSMNICRSTQLACETADPHANISPCVPTRFAFSKKKEGIFPKIERELVGARKAVKRKMGMEKEGSDRHRMYDAEQNELKIAANSLYGLLGTTTSDVSLLSGAYSVTAWGAYFIQRVCDELHTQFGTELQIIYGDTDSLFIRMIEVTDLEYARKRAIELQDWVNAKLNTWMHTEFNIPNSVMKMEAENLTYPFLLLEKKKYVKHIYQVKPSDKPEEAAEYPKLKPSGIFTRSHTKYTKDLMNDILKEGMVKNAPQEDVHQMIRSRIRALHLGEIPDITILKHSTNLSKPVEAYASDTPHLIAAKQMLHDDLNLDCGDRVEFYYCKVATSRDQKKKEFVVSAHKVHEYELEWSFYVDEVVSALECVVQPLLNVDVHVLTDTTQFGKRTVWKKRTAPSHQETELDRIVVKRTQGVEAEEEVLPQAPPSLKVTYQKGYTQMYAFGAKMPAKRAAVPKKRTSASARTRKGKGKEKESMTVDVIRNMFMKKPI